MSPATGTIPMWSGAPPRTWSGIAADFDNHRHPAEPVARTSARPRSCPPALARSPRKSPHRRNTTSSSPRSRLPRTVLDAFLTGAGARTEHYEIAAHEELVTKAGVTRGPRCLTSFLESISLDDAARSSFDCGRSRAPLRRCRASRRSPPKTPIPGQRSQP